MDIADLLMILILEIPSKHFCFTQVIGSKSPCSSYSQGEGIIQDVDPKGWRSLEVILEAIFPHPLFPFVLL